MPDDLDDYRVLGIPDEQARQYRDTRIDPAAALYIESQKRLGEKYMAPPPFAPVYIPYEPEPRKALAVAIGLLILTIGLVTSSYWYRPMIRLLNPPPPSFSYEHYVELSANARSLASQGGQNVFDKIDYLYGRYFSERPRDWGHLTEERRTAVAAAWIAFSKYPHVLESMSAEQRSFFCEAFPDYLASLKHAGDTVAAKDLGSLQSPSYCRYSERN